MIREQVKQGLLPICHNSLARLFSSVGEIIVLCPQSFFDACGKVSSHLPWWS